MVISELWLSTIIIIVITHIRIFLKVHQTEKLKCKYFTSVLVYYNKIYFKNKKIKIWEKSKTLTNNPAELRTRNNISKKLKYII
jgi:TfoX/Sxy family transcriptional regulator of competence genes